MSDPKTEKAPQTQLQPMQISAETLIAAFAAAMKANAPDASLLTGMSQERLDRVRGIGAKPGRYRIIKGKSRETGATFDMFVLESRAHKDGRVVRLENYKHPKEAYIPMSRGGMLPDGAHVWMDHKQQGELSDSTPGTQLSIHFKQWRWETFWKQDLARVANGNPLRVENCVDGSFALEVPWSEDSLYTESAAE